jgi:hypothetical protein
MLAGMNGHRKLTRVPIIAWTQETAFSFSKVPAQAFEARGLLKAKMRGRPTPGGSAEMVQKGSIFLRSLTAVLGVACFGAFQQGNRLLLLGHANGGAKRRLDLGLLGTHRCEPHATSRCSSAHHQRSPEVSASASALDCYKRFGGYGLQDARLRPSPRA